VTQGPALDHDAAFELLPWLANGSLSRTEREGVERHIRSCIACRRELKDLEHLRLAVRSQPTLHLAAQGGLDRLERELDRETARQRASLLARHTALFRFAVAASVGVAFLGALLWLAPTLQDRAGYSTLATEPREQSAQIDVIFNQQTPAADIQSLLKTIDGEIVAGPSELGRYSVRIRDGRASDREIAASIERLARDPRVRFAGRAFTESTR
jgi:anti-sigma factor RsiW